MDVLKPDPYSRRVIDSGYMILLPLLFAQQLASCVTNEINAFRFKFISPGHTALAVGVFYPGLCYATQRLNSWADGVYERQVHMSRKAKKGELRNNTILTAKQKEEMPKLTREIGYMDPKIAPFALALLPLNLRARLLDRWLAPAYRIWFPAPRLGPAFMMLRQATTTTPFIGLLAVFAGKTLMGYKSEADKHQERTL
ncbi:hypothetical protein PG985_008554 [Apiospora marii]|uniref:Uncharacterized protein n=1 Tax=Apiospora marii TaxID=335849 RepID=A0ABR1R2Z1_9PEZI